MIPSIQSLQFSAAIGLTRLLLIGGLMDIPLNDVNVEEEILARQVRNSVEYYIDGNASKPHIMIFDENEIFHGNIFLILFSIKCQWIVPKFVCKVYQNGKNRRSNHSVASLF